jgi:hypothetical protein
MVGHGTEQTAIHTRFLRQLDGGTAEFFALGLHFGQLGGCSFFQFGAFGFEFSLVRCRGTTSAAGRDQEVACVTVFHFDDFTQIAQVDDFVEQNDLHGRVPYRLRCWSL